MVVDATEVGNINFGRRFRISKATASANTISISHVIWEYMGPDTPAAGDLIAYNSEASDADEARESSVLFYGRQSGQESLPMAQIEAHHNGASDDIKGELDIKLNTGTRNIGNLYSFLKLSTTIDSLSDSDATPSVADGNIFKTANTGATTITNFDNGVTGKRITVIIGDANTTIDFTDTNLKGNGGADWSPTTNDHMTCVYDGTNWYCDVSDNTP